MRKLTILLMLFVSMLPLRAEIKTGSCGDNVTYTIDTETGVLTISGNGTMANYYWKSVGSSYITNAPWGEYLSTFSTAVIENGVTSIGESAFDGCSSLTSVTIPNSVTSIGRYAFNGCSSLTSVTIPNSVTNIGEYAFNGCKDLASMTVGNSVTNIGTYAFTAVYISKENLINNSSCELSDITVCDAEQEDGLLIKDKMAVFCRRKATSVTIPDSVTNIGNSAFSGCSNLTSVTIPNSVTNIGKYAFQNCSRLTSLVIPNSVTSIIEETFAGCTGLTSVTIGNSVGSINQYAFNGCNGIKKLIFAEGCTIVLETGLKSITSVTIPNTVKIIGNNAFYRCSGLTSVTIPNSVTSIGNNAFCGCSGLTSVTIPNSVTNIGTYAFRDCTELTSATIGNSMKEIGDGVFYNCSALTSVTIPNSVTSIGIHAFSYCSLTSVTIPNSVKNIENNAFYRCSHLTSVTIPNSVISIGQETFRDCYEITSIKIGSSVTTIKNYAFCGCSNISSITSYAKEPPYCYPSVFKNVSDEAKLYVYASCADAYRNADTWKNFEIETIPDPRTQMLDDLSKLYDEYKDYTFKVGTEIGQYGKEEVKAFNAAKFEASNILIDDSDYTDDEIREAIDNLKATYKAVLASKVEVCELIDGSPISLAEEKTYSTLTYTRNFKNTNWQPLYVPFSMEYSDWASQGLEVARLNGFYEYDDNHDGTVDRSALEILIATDNDGLLKPNHPYMVRADKAEEKTIRLSNATLYPTEENTGDCSTFETKYNFKGTYSQISKETLNGMNAYIMSGGSLKPSSSVLNPMRWYMTRESRGGQMLPKITEIKVFVHGEDDATTLDFVNADSEEGTAYNLIGQRVAPTQKGLLIRNGKKMLVK